LLNVVRFFKAKSSATNAFSCSLNEEAIFYKRKNTAIKINNVAKNVPKICIKLCAAGIFGCRICICSI